MARHEKRLFGWRSVTALRRKCFTFSEIFVCCHHRSQGWNGGHVRSVVARMSDGCMRERSITKIALIDSVDDDNS